MMESRLFAVIFGTLALIGIVFVTGFPEWSRNSQQSSEEFVRNQYVFQGIWWRCISTKPGFFQCDSYDVSILGLPSDIQACRALMCIACAFSFFGLIVSILSLECTNAVEPETKSKSRTALAAGICYLLAGLACGVGVSWYAWRVTFEFFNPLYQQREFKYEYGSCLYVGWVSMALAFVASILLIVSSCQSEHKEKYTPATTAYRLQQSKTKSAEARMEYV